MFGYIEFLRVGESPSRISEHTNAQGLFLGGGKTGDGCTEMYARRLVT